MFVLPDLAVGAPAITIVSPEALSVDLREPPDPIVVRNDTAATVMLEVSTVLEKGTVTVNPEPDSVPAHAVRVVDLTFTSATDDLETEGVLVVAAGSEVPAVIPLTFERNANDEAIQLVIGTLLLAGVIVAFGASFLKWNQLGHLMGPANWDFSKSWASTITVAGALLGTIFAAGVLPENTHWLPKEAYAGLNVLFGMLVLAAPIVYSALARLTGKAGGGQEPKAHGRVVGFLFSAALTAWGVCGELATLFLLFAEIWRANTLPDAIVYAAWFVLGLISVSMAIYVFASIRAILQSQPKPPVDAEGVVQLPSWSPF
jgi:hypothetical protein